MVEMAVCEMTAQNAVCREYKLQLVKVMVKNREDFIDFQEYTEVVSLDSAKKVFGEGYADFMKRNRFGDKTALILMSRIKKEEDAAALKPYIEKQYNGWVNLTKLSDADREKVLANCSDSDRLNAWDNLSFDEMDAKCASCPLRWFKGEDCVGTFGPATSELPMIAERNGCPIVASAVKSAEEQKQFTPEDAKELLRETEVLAPVLVTEGKMAVHRYSGPVERMKALAEACIRENCNFTFM